jgi:hypothetical protein
VTQVSKIIIEKEIEGVSDTDNARTDFKDPKQFQVKEGTNSLGGVLYLN